MEHFDVVIIGAGPSGACAGALLSKAGKKVLCVEKQHFPRFSIGESLLPHCMEFLAAAGLEPALAGRPAERLLGNYPGPSQPELAGLMLRPYEALMCWLR